MSHAVPIVRTGGLRRVLVVLMLSCGMVAASALPSWAAFVDSVRVTGSIATATVAAPGAVTAVATCKGRTATVDVTWNASTAPRVSGYHVRLYLNNAWQDQKAPAAGATSWQGSADVSYLTSYTMTFTVTTLTAYGWTTESARSAPVVCS